MLGKWTYPLLSLNSYSSLPSGILAQKKKKKKDMVSHLQSSINSNDSASLSFIIHQARLHNWGNTVPHTPPEGHSPSVCSLFYVPFTSPALRGKSKKCLAKQTVTVGSAFRRIIHFIYYFPLISWFNLVAQRSIQTVVAQLQISTS